MSDTGNPSTDGIRRTPLHRALHRPNLLLGGERKLVLTVGVLAAALVFSALNLVAGTVGGLVWFGAMWGLRRMGKADPQMSDVYRRHLAYRPYYPARSTPWASEQHARQWR